MPKSNGLSIELNQECFICGRQTEQLPKQKKLMEFRNIANESAGIIIQAWFTTTVDNSWKYCIICRCLADVSHQLKIMCQNASIKSTNWPEELKKPLDELNRIRDRVKCNICNQDLAKSSLEIHMSKIHSSSTENSRAKRSRNNNSADRSQRSHTSTQDPSSRLSTQDPSSRWSTQDPSLPDIFDQELSNEHSKQNNDGSDVTQSIENNDEQRMDATDTAIVENNTDTHQCKTSKRPRREGNSATNARAATSHKISRINDETRVRSKNNSVKVTNNNNSTSIPSTLNDSNLPMDQPTNDDSTFIPSIDPYNNSNSTQSLYNESNDTDEISIIRIKRCKVSKAEIDQKRDESRLIDKSTMNVTANIPKNVTHFHIIPPQRVK